MGGFLWSDSFICVRGREWLCVLFVEGKLLGPCGLHIPECGWRSLCCRSCSVWLYLVVSGSIYLSIYLSMDVLVNIYICINRWR